MMGCYLTIQTHCKRRANVPSLRIKKYEYFTVSSKQGALIGHHIGLTVSKKGEVSLDVLICCGRRADYYGPAILSTAAARCTPCYRRNTSRGAALLEEEAVRLRNCTGPADLKQGRVLVGLRGAALIRCHYAEWDRYYCVRVHNASFRGTATPKKKEAHVG